MVKQNGRLIAPATQKLITRVRLVGQSPLLMHNIRGADPLSSFALRMKELNAAKKRSGSDKEVILGEMAHLETIAGCYHNDSLGFHLPGRMLGAALKSGAKHARNGKNTERGVDPFPSAALEHKGPSTPEELAKDTEFVHAAFVTVGRAKVMRYRPVFSEWAVEFNCLHDGAILDQTSLLQAWAAAGAYEGIGDGRALGFGRFTVYQIDE